MKEQYEKDREAWEIEMRKSGKDVELAKIENKLRAAKEKQRNFSRDSMIKEAWINLFMLS